MTDDGILRDLTTKAMNDIGRSLHLTTQLLDDPVDQIMLVQGVAITSMTKAYMLMNLASRGEVTVDEYLDKIVPLMRSQMEDTLETSQGLMSIIHDAVEEYADKDGVTERDVMEIIDSRVKAMREKGQ